MGPPAFFFLWLWRGKIKPCFTFPALHNNTQRDPPPPKKKVSWVLERPRRDGEWQNLCYESTSRHSSSINLSIPGWLVYLSIYFPCVLSPIHLSLRKFSHPCQAGVSSPTIIMLQDGTHGDGGGRRAAYKYFHIVGIVKNWETDGWRGRTDGSRCSKGQSVDRWKKNTLKIIYHRWISPFSHHTCSQIIKCLILPPVLLWIPQNINDPNQRCSP